MHTDAFTNKVKILILDFEAQIISIAVFSFFGTEKIMLLKWSCPMFVVLVMTSLHGQSDATNVDITPCLQSNWISCGINLGTAVFQLHTWSSDVPYQVRYFLN